jgi:membrane protease YdiL (CAAX protease family)
VPTRGEGRVTPVGANPSGVEVLEPGSPERRQLVVETWFVMIAFLAAPLMSAVVLFAQHVQGDAGITRFPTIVHNDAANMVLGILDYLPVAALVPLGLLLLARTGQRPVSLGLGRPRLDDDLVPAFGLAVLAFLGDLALAVPLSPLLTSNTKLVNPVPVGHVPAYYVVWGVAVSAITAIAEETFVNAYLLTRLEQLGWSPGRSLALSLTLRTSYHVYYGVAFLLTVPFGYVVTRSFQKHRRLNRAIAAHFIFDAAQLVITILTG